MLIGDVFYYDTNGNRASDMDRNVSSAYAHRASRGFHGFVQWVCANGEHDVTWYRDGQIVATPAFAK